MTVAELIEELRKLPQHMQVKVAEDRTPEGDSEDIDTVRQRGGVVLLRGIDG